MSIWIELYQYLFLNWWKCKLLNTLSHYFLRLISIFKNWSIDHNTYNENSIHSETQEMFNFLQFFQSKFSILLMLFHK